MPARNPKVPKFILLIFYAISIIKMYISLFILQILCFLKLTDSEITPSNMHAQTESDLSVEVSTNLIRRTLPSTKFEELILIKKVDASDQDSCAICLFEYEGGDDIRKLMNCRHIFHESCLDRWMFDNQTTCPLCRTCLVPIQMVKKASKEYNLNVSV
ncbi:hypothetical protein MKW98_002810 [Papaver atlanticum]|uniref:RING-type domain-containing protein n=1 Tax=Papaver atlanticum TaxID=357466 RepID=A0AAD4TJ51_9MAGN|nr:hypothetical protein MKW98_002810 [Papaver atlanticum]